MSDENAPKLRLKPKLASDTTAAQQQPAAASPAPVEPAPPAAAPAGEEPRNVRLKPRINIAPVQETVAEPEPVAAPPPPEPAPVEPPPPVPEKPVAKFSLKPKTPAAEPAPALVPTEEVPPSDAPGAEVPASLDAPPPAAATAETDRGEEGEPGEITAMRRASVMPFHAPPPPAGVPFPPLAGAQFPPPSAKKPAATGSRKNLIMVGGGAVAVFVLGVLVGRFTAPREEPPPSPPPNITAQPATPQGQAAATAREIIEKAREEAAAPLNEVVEADPAIAMPAPPTATPVAIKVAESADAPEPEPAVVVPVAPPPPPASPAFKAWVQGLRIGGVRGGENPRVFIGGTPYIPGDLVNPKLGISFDGYNSETRMLTFKDKSGATVDRRN